MPSVSPRRRVTVSLLVTGEVASEIDGMRRALGAAALQRIPPHVTVVPPVNVREDHLEEAVRVVRAAAVTFGPIRLELGAPATFWPENPVVYLQVTGDDLEDLGRLRAACTAGPLATPAARRPEREYIPHVTLDQRIAPARIPATLEALGSYRAVTTVGRVTLLELVKGSRRWVPFADAALAPTRIAGRGGIELELSLSSMLDPGASRFQEVEWAQYGRESYGERAEIDEPFAITARCGVDGVDRVECGIAGSGSEVVGVAAGQLRGRLCRLGNLIVAARWRSHGFGSHLLAEVERLAGDRGCDVVRVDTRANGRSESFYLAHGYVVVAKLPAWRHGQDFVMMERRVSS